MRRLLARLLRMPPPGEEVPTQLEIIPADGGEIWRRDFGGYTLCSRQYLADTTLIERFGPIELRLIVTPTAGGLDFRQRSVALRLGPMTITLPRWLSPGVRAKVRPASLGDRFKVSVAIALHGPGWISAYHGRLDRKERS